MTHVLKGFYYKYILFFIGIVSIIYISGTLKIDQNIANKSMGYFVQKNVEQANEAARLGYIKYEVNDYAEVFGINWEWKPGMHRMRIIRSGPDDYDDIGYISLLELIAIGRKIIIDKEINPNFVDKMHNLSFIIAAALLSFIIAKFFKNIFAGWIFMLLILIFKSKILSLVYGSPDSRTFVVFFPLVVVSIIFGLNWLSIRFDKFWSWALILLFGLLIGMLLLIRRSEGMMAILVILFCIAFLKTGIKQKAVTVTLLAIGFFLITTMMPIAFAVHRDIKTGEFNGDMSQYLQTIGNHQSWHSIVIGIGKYPNSINMKFDDIALYDIIRSKYPDSMDTVLNFHGKGYYKAMQNVYFEYIIDHPVEYLTNIAKAYAELFYFIPYATSVGNSTQWRYGYLPAKEGITLDDWDFPINIGKNNLLNLKYRYLKLTSTEWGIFILAVFTIILAIRSAFLVIGEGNIKNIFLHILFYMFLAATIRALIPYHGLSFIVIFWITSIISLLYLCVNSTILKSFLYWRLKVFDI